MWVNQNFQSRVLLVFVGLLVLALLSAWMAMFFAAKRANLGLAERQLMVADRLVQKVFETTDLQLRDSGHALAADAGFRTAVASRDAPAIISALENQGARINADLAILMDETGTVIASAGGNARNAIPASLAEALSQVRAHSQTPAILHYRDGLLQVAIVPMRASAAIGWLAMGFVLRDNIVEQIKDTLGVDMSLLLIGDGPRVGVAASTLPAAARASLAAIDATRLDRSRKVQSLALSEETYLSLLTAGISSVSDGYFVMLELPTEAVAGPMDALRRQVLMSGAIIVIICLGAAMLSARMLAQPVRALADAARSMTLSKRRTTPKGAQSDDELANLTEAFHALAQRAHYDALTGLPNRTLLKDRLDDSMQRMKLGKSPMAVVFIDLDGFKRINDTLGHEMGDLVLRKTAQRLTRSLPPPNTVARLGGDEFVLILEGTSESAALKLVDRLTEVVSTPMRSPTGSIKIGMSAGIAMYPNLGVDRETLLKQADAAMYQSKTRKCGPVVARAANPAKHDESPVAGQTDDLTWSGHWHGKDLTTQNTRTLQSVSTARTRVRS